MLKLMKSRWVLIWLILVSLALIAVISLAAYKSANNKIKRVIAPAAKSDALFTSNYLALGSNNIKPAYFQETQTSPFSYKVLIRNFNPADPGQIYDGTINYSLRVELVHRNETPYDPNDPDDAAVLAAMSPENQAISVSLPGQAVFTIDGSTANLSHTFSGLTLTGTGSTGTHEWTVAYTNIDINSDLCIKFTAETTNSDLDNIYATIFTATYPVVRTQGWKCTLVEAEGDSSSAHIDEYDGFNYTIAGTGTNTLKFSYDSSKITINPACWELDSTVAAPAAYSGTAEGTHGSDWKTIVITADPETTGINRYDFQAYKVDSYQPDSYNEIKPNITGGYIEFEES